MGKRFAIVIGAAALGAAVMAAGASADFRSVHDPRGDTTCVHDGASQGQPCSDSKRRDADIVRATAGHDGTRLRHTIRVVGKFQEGALWLNTDSDPGCEFYLSIDRGAGKSKFRECFTGRRGSRARFDFHRHSVEIFFSERSIGNPRSYGWRAGTVAGSSKVHASDNVPCRRPGAPPRCWIRPRLGDSGAAAAGAMALGAQTAAAPDVVKYDTKLGITTDGCCLYHGGVKSDRDRDPAYHPANAVRKCMEGRRVILFEQRPGADRRLGTARSHFKPRLGQGYWQHNLRRSHRAVYAKVTRKVGKRFVCRADRSGTKHVHMPGAAGT